MDWYRVSVPYTLMLAWSQKNSVVQLPRCGIVPTDSGEKTLLNYNIHGGSNEGQDYSVRAWFNTTDEIELLIRIYTEEADDTVYNLSVSQGTWVDVIEDDDGCLPEVRFGDVVQCRPSERTPQ